MTVQVLEVAGASGPLRFFEQIEGGVDNEGVLVDSGGAEVGETVAAGARGAD